ncbi:hypothetical protein BDV26DRAFT_259274 [Aspergillus bertholletiae]|uniref:Uncharacterized protein n=1 Tax=Aspergillus bertholletiae TaxID=1226010 RepID=A0A5N7BCT0_9EURO|nr:hypothetical protein BDV26DRAFT_259274 [Aspergillus bertholletiae]
MEVRTKKIIRTRIFGTSSCSHPLRRDPTVIYIRHARPKSPCITHPPRYKIIEPRKPRQAKLHPNASIRTSSPMQSRPLRFCFPFLDRTTDSNQALESESTIEWELSSDEVSTASDRANVCRPRGCHRPRRLFVVGKPENEKRTQLRTLCSPPPKKRLIRSPTKIRFGSDIEADGVDVSPHYRRSQRPSWNSRQPRDTTLSSEHKPSRREASNVEFHNHHRANPLEEQARTRSRRKVRFASDVEYVKNTNKAREARVKEQERHHAQSHRRYSSSSSLNRDLGTADNSATCGLGSPETLLKERCQIRSAYSERARPRIIHIGNRQMSEAAERIRKEAWRRHSREDLLSNLKSHSGWHRYARRFDERITMIGGSR